MALNPAELNRLRWRCRRGLLELDILLCRLLDRYAQELNEHDLMGLMALLEYPDNDLWDIVLGKSEQYDASWKVLVARLRNV